MVSNGRPRSTSHRRRAMTWLFGSLGAAAAVAIGMAAFGGVINLTSSAPIGLWIAETAAIEPGTVILFCAPASVAELGLERQYIRSGHCPGGAGPLIKRVAATGPAAISITDTGVTVDGAVLRGTAPAAADGAGRPLQRFRTDAFDLQPGMIWTVGWCPSASWDSRYWGPVAITDITATLRPLLVVQPGGCQ